MRTKNELYQEALRTVALRRQTARALAQDAQAQAEAAIPALRHAEEEVRVRGIRCALAGAAGKDRTEAAAALADARQKLTALLAESGRPADALEPHFTCPKCQDTGSVNGRTCACVHKVMQQLRRQEIEALSSLSISSFDTMKLEYYPSVADPEIGESIRTYMAEVLADLRDYAADFSPATRESLLLLGNAGLGKTHAALAIAGEVLRQNYDVIYVSCPDFFGKLEALHFGSDPNGEEEALFQTASNAEQPAGRKAAHHRHHQCHRWYFAGKALHRKDLQPPCRFRPDQVLRQRYPRSESERVKEKATQKALLFLLLKIPMQG